MKNLMFLVIFLLLSCKNNKDKGHPEALIVKSHSALYTESSEKSREIRRLSPDESLVDLGQVSRNTSTIKLGGTYQEEPWLKVTSYQGDTGWVFLGVVAPPHPDSLSSRKWLVNKRLYSLFGHELAKAALDWAGQNTPQNVAGFAGHYRTGQHLKDTLNSILSQRISVGLDGALPDLFWMSEISPYWFIQTISEGRAYHLFFHEKNLARAAALTDGKEDDLFMEVCQLAFAPDSIESFFPCWKMQVDDYTSYSLLGKGKHVEMFQKIEKSKASGTLFAPELTKWKDLLLDDVLNNNVQYWNNADKIREELARILSAKYLQGRETMALQTRLLMFEKPAENGIKVDVRSGN